MHSPHLDECAQRGVLEQLVDLIADLLVEELLRRGAGDGPQDEDTAKPGDTGAAG